MLATTPHLAHAQKAPSKVSPDLKQLYDDYQRGKSLQRTPSKSTTPELTTPAPIIQDGKVLIDATASANLSALRGDLSSLGLSETGAYGKTVSGWLSVADVESLDDVSSLRYAQPAYAMTSVGAVDSQGDAAMKTDQVRSTLGFDGTGLTVGILSDSWDCTGVAPTAADDVASGDLPAGVVVLDDLTSGCIDEGRAMGQLIYDSAPGTDLAFHTAFGGQANFAQGILDLAAAGSDVIVDDVIYFAEPMFSDGIIAQAADAVAAAGIPYFSSAGNGARQSYEAPYRPSGTTVLGLDAHDFDPGPGVDVWQSLTFSGSSVPFSFQWDDPFFSATGGAGADTDLDFCISTAPNADPANLVGCSAANNIASGDPVEVFGLSGNTTFYFAILKFAGPDPDRVKYVWFDNAVSGLEYATNSSSSYGHSNAAGAEAVGAARYDATPAFGTSPPGIEPFSAAGGTPILFETDGTPKASPEVRLKPGITAPDGTNTTFFGFDYEPDGFPNFFGTSAAAPHAAAAAALMLQANPALTPQQVYEALRNTAIDMDDPFTAGFDSGFDFGTGFGLVDALAAVQSVQTAVECTPTTLAESEPFLGADDVGRVDLTFSSPDGITTIDFSLLNNLELETSSPSFSSQSTGPDGLPTYTYASAPTSIDIRLKQVDDTIEEAGYFGLASSLCPTPDNSEAVLTVEFDPPLAMPLSIPERFALDAAYPNPASGPATIGYALPEATDVTLAVYDVLGRQVAMLVDGPQAAGRHEAVLDTKRLPSGMYVYRLTAGQQTQTRRLLLVK